MVAGVLVSDPDAELKLADGLAKLRNQGAMLCTCDCSLPPCTHPHGVSEERQEWREASGPSDEPRPSHLREESTQAAGVCARGTAPTGGLGVLVTMADGGQHRTWMGQDMTSRARVVR